MIMIPLTLKAAARRYVSSISLHQVRPLGTRSGWTDAQVVQGMQTWVDEVHKPQSYPLLSNQQHKSKYCDYEIVVCQDDRYTVQRDLVCAKVMDLAATCTATATAAAASDDGDGDGDCGPYLTTLIVFPNISTGSTEESEADVARGESKGDSTSLLLDLYVGALDHCDGVAGNIMDDLQPRNDKMKVQAVPFRDFTNTNTNTLGGQGLDNDNSHITSIQNNVAPWDMIQLLRYQDLKKLVTPPREQQGQGHHTDDVDDGMSNKEKDTTELEYELLQSCRPSQWTSQESPKVIQFTNTKYSQAISTDQMDILKAQGILVETVDIFDGEENEKQQDNTIAHLRHLRNKKSKPKTKRKKR
jgi:hypothetical protein